MIQTSHLGIHSLALALVFFVSCMILDGCGKKGQAGSTLEEAGDQLEQVVDDHTQEDWFESEDGTVDYASDDNETDYSESVEEEAQADYTSTDYSSSSSSSSQKKYMIVAGNYLLEDNANDMVRKLRNSGYNSAETVVFDLSQYHTVIAARYDDRSSADRIAERLKNEGFDNYVLGSSN